MPGMDDERTKYGDITSVTPVGKINRISNQKGARVKFVHPDQDKFKNGDRVYITRQDKTPGYLLFDMKTFTLDDADGEYFTLYDAEGNNIDSSWLEGDVEGGYAQLNNDVYEGKSPSSRKNAKSPSEV